MRVLVIINIILLYGLFLLVFFIFKMQEFENYLDGIYNRVIIIEQNINKEIELFKRIKNVIDRKGIKIIDVKQAKFILVDTLDNLKNIGETKIKGDLKDNGNVLIYEVSIKVSESKVPDTIKLLKELDNNVSPIFKIRRFSVVGRELHVELELLQPYFRGKTWKENI